MRGIYNISAIVFVSVSFFTGAIESEKMRHCDLVSSGNLEVVIKRNEIVRSEDSKE